MNDKTIYIKGPDLHKWQKDFVRLFNDHKKEPSIFVIKSPRQVGKSFLMEILLIYVSLEKHDSVSWFISPTLGQARKVFKDILKMLRDINIIKKVNNQVLEIYLSNGSEIHFGSAALKESLRGNTVTGEGILVIDECAFVDELTLGIVYPYTNVYKRPIIMVSTPLFKTGRFYNMFAEPPLNVYRFDVCDYDLSFFINDSQKQMFKQTMTSQKYLQDIEGLFLTETSDVFGNFAAVLSNNYDISDNYYYMGIDWGSGTENDYTAVSVFNKHKQQVFLDYFNNMDATLTIQRIALTVERFLPQRITVEQNSIGRIFYDMLKKTIRNRLITLFNTTNDSKNKIINNLLLLILNKEVLLLDDTEQKLQLVSYLILTTGSGNKITFNAASGLHDDIIIADAIALYSMRTGGYAVR